MKKILLIMLLTFTTFAYADGGKYIAIQDSNTSDTGVWVLNTENGDIKHCYWGLLSEMNTEKYGVRCSRWRLNNENEIYAD